jgi:hypothetical protein
MKILVAGIVGAACGAVGAAVGKLIEGARRKAVNTSPSNETGPRTRSTGRRIWPSGDTELGPIPDHLRARIREAEEKAWWKDLTGLVGESDRQLVVIKPRSDATADDLRGLGRALERWRAETPQARHIWGLADLLEGRPPRTPPIYLAIPFPMDRLDEQFEPVALVNVAEGTDIQTATRGLYVRLRGFHSKLVWFEDPDSYSRHQR